MNRNHFVGLPFALSPSAALRRALSKGRSLDCAL